MGKVIEDTDSGGRGKELSLDMSSSKDRALLNQAVKSWPKRWRGLSDAVKAELAAGLHEANAVARRELNGESPLEAAKAVAQIVGVAVRMEGQQQADDHHADNLEVARANAVSAAAQAGLVKKVYLGLDPEQV